MSQMTRAIFRINVTDDQWYLPFVVFSLFNCYRISMSQMTSGIFRLSYSQSRPSFKTYNRYDIIVILTENVKYQRGNPKT
jgi:hypothetical protein